MSKWYFRDIYSDLAIEGTVDSAINIHTGDLELATSYSDAARPASGLHICRGENCEAVAWWVKGSGRGINEPFFRAKHVEGCSEATQISEKYNELDESGRRYDESPEIIKPDYYDFLVAHSDNGHLSREPDEDGINATHDGGTRHTHTNGSREFSSRRLSVVLKNLRLSNEVYDLQWFELERSNGSIISLPGHTVIRNFSELMVDEAGKSFIVWGSLENATYSQDRLFFNSGARSDPSICLPDIDQELADRLFKYFKIEQSTKLQNRYIIGVGTLRYTENGGFTVWVKDYSKLWVS